MASAAHSRMNIGFLLTAAEAAPAAHGPRDTAPYAPRAIAASNISIPPLPAFDRVLSKHEVESDTHSPVAVMGFNADAELQSQILREVQIKSLPPTCAPPVPKLPPPSLPPRDNEKSPTNVLLPPAADYDSSLPCRTSSLPLPVLSTMHDVPTAQLLHRQTSLPTEYLAASAPISTSAATPNLSIDDKVCATTGPGPGGGGVANNTTNSISGGTAKKYVCDVPGCKAEFGQKGSLTRHHKSRHEGRRPHACGQCSKRFSEKWTLNVHERNVHEKRKPHVCGQCPKRFGERWNLRKHINVVHRNIKPYKCPQCKRAFGYKGDMRKHVMELHVQDGRPFQCPIPSCGVKFARLRYLRRHQNLSHGTAAINNNNIANGIEIEIEEDDDERLTNGSTAPPEDDDEDEGYLRRQERGYGGLDKIIIGTKNDGKKGERALLTTENVQRRDYDNKNDSLSSPSVVQRAIPCDVMNNNTKTRRRDNSNNNYSPLETLSHFAAAAAAVVDEEKMIIRKGAR